MLYRDRQVFFVPVLQIRQLWYRDGKQRAKPPRFPHSSTQLPVDDIAHTLTANLAVQGLDEELVPDSAVTSDALEDQSC